jgi:hypothetical protein
MQLDDDSNSLESMVDPSRAMKGGHMNFDLYNADNPTMQTMGIAALNTSQRAQATPNTMSVPPRQFFPFHRLELPWIPIHGSATTSTSRGTGTDSGTGTGTGMVVVAKRTLNSSGNDNDNDSSSRSAGPKHAPFMAAEQQYAALTAPASTRRPSQLVYDTARTPRRCAPARIAIWRAI